MSDIQCQVFIAVVKFIWIAKFMIYQRQRPNQSSLPPFPIKVKTHGVHFNQDQFTCTGISQALEVDTMFFNGSARVQLWLGLHLINYQ
jgi:hypothetical protein